MSQKATNRYRRERLAIATAEFIALFILWLILSGRYQAKYISFGALSAGLVTFLTNDLIYSLFNCDGTAKTTIRSVLLQAGRFLAYIPWLFYQIILANIQVAYLVLHPRLPVNPALLQVRTRLRSSLAQVIVAIPSP